MSEAGVIKCTHTHTRTRTHTHTNASEGVTNHVPSKPFSTICRSAVTNCVAMTNCRVGGTNRRVGVSDKSCLQNNKFDTNCHSSNMVSEWENVSQHGACLNQLKDVLPQTLTHKESNCWGIRHSFFFRQRHWFLLPVRTVGYSSRGRCVASFGKDVVSLIIVNTIHCRHDLLTCRQNRGWNKTYS